MVSESSSHGPRQSSCPTQLHPGCMAHPFSSPSLSFLICKAERSVRAKAVSVRTHVSITAWVCGFVPRRFSRGLFRRLCPAAAPGGQRGEPPSPPRLPSGVRAGVVILQVGTPKHAASPTPPTPPGRACSPRGRPRRAALAGPRSRAIAQPDLSLPRPSALFLRSCHSLCTFPP